ncbi:accessory gene regulator B family protein [Evansella sp. AB-rgal1]|uniref:accessory gene regulator B family protein n=1 Tax=Evansella sp. AB-rgal1 TaxID=3242696 RepID=UPI00359CBEB8
MINQISQRTAVFLCNLTDRNKEVEYVRYGLEIIIGAILKGFTLLGLAYILGFIIPMLGVFITFAVFRSLTGGHHYSTYSRCLFSGVIIFLSISFASTKLVNIISSEKYVVLLLLSVLFGLLLAYFYAPSNHFYKKMSERQLEKLRKLSLFFIFLWGGIIYFLHTKFGLQEWILASILGFIAQLSSIHPITYKFVERMEEFINRMEGIK